MSKKLTSREVYKLIADYVYELFRIFDNKYKSAPIKVQKLLFIAEMVNFYCYKKSLFPNDVMFECNYCGFKIPVFTDCTKEFISNGDTADEVIVPTNEETIKIDELNIIYVLKGLDYQNINIIKDTVIAFGKYSPVTLGELLNDFKKNSQSSTFEKQLPFTFTKKDFDLLLLNLMELKEKNAIANFILDYNK